MARDLPGLARAFGCSLSPRSLRDIDFFLQALECIDRVLDPLPDMVRRTTLGRAIVDSVCGSGTLSDAALTPELSRHVDRLREVVTQSERADEFRKFSLLALTNAERMKATRSVREYIARSRREGRLLVELVLLLLPDAAPRLVAFLRGVAGICNLFDKLTDAGLDYSRGELAIPPGIRFYAPMFAVFARGLPAAYRLYPSLLGLVTWSAGYLVIMGMRTLLKS